jgi:hypothetical protein
VGHVLPPMVVEVMSVAQFARRCLATRGQRLLGIYNLVSKFTRKVQGTCGGNDVAAIFSEHAGRARRLDPRPDRALGGGRQGGRHQGGRHQGGRHQGGLGRGLVRFFGPRLSGRYQPESGVVMPALSSSDLTRPRTLASIYPGGHGVVVAFLRLALTPPKDRD